jgi:hypothetical protein
LAMVICPSGEHIFGNTSSWKLTWASWGTRHMIQINYCHSSRRDYEHTILVIPKGTHHMNCCYYIWRIEHCFSCNEINFNMSFIISNFPIVKYAYFHIAYWHINGNQI